MGYENSVEAMRYAANYFNSASLEWDKASQHLSQASLSDGALGILGRMAGVPKAYNRVLAMSQNTLFLGAGILGDNEQILLDVATAYERADGNAAKAFEILKKLHGEEE